jgi:hypothetical protein
MTSLSVIPQREGVECEEIDPPPVALPGAQQPGQPVVPTWDDVDELHEAPARLPLDVESELDREFIVRIVNWSLFLRKRARLPELDRDQLLLSIGEHFIKMIVLPAEAKKREVDLMDWEVGYAVEWWNWATTGKDMPLLPRAVRGPLPRFLTCEMQAKNLIKLDLDKFCADFHFAFLCSRRLHLENLES